MMRYMNVHEPALEPQEAALLPAIPNPSIVVSRRSNLLWPADERNFRAFEVSSDTAAPIPVSNASQRQGSMAGRAVLTAAGVSLPGVEGMRRGCRRMMERQQIQSTCPVELELL